MNSKSSMGLVNMGIVEINPQPFTGEATVVIAGLTRSGTSMIGSLLHCLGVPLGPKFDKAVFEDVELAGLLESGDGEGFTRAVNARNAAHPVWGFKRPNAYRRLDHIAGQLRQPRLIVLFRDVLAIAMRNHVSMQMEVLPSLPGYIEEYGLLAQNLARVTCPALLVSYEKFIQFPEPSIMQVAAFCGIEIGPEKLERAMGVIANGPDIYLQSSRLRYQGHVDRVINGRLCGWAMVEGEPKIKAKVQLAVNGSVVASGVANRLRKDLLAARIGDGEHGFEIAFDASLDPAAIVEVMAGNAGFVLANSGKPLSAYVF